MGLFLRKISACDAKIFVDAGCEDMGIFSGYLNDARAFLVGDFPKRNPVESELSVACGDQSSQSIQECCFTNSRRANDCDAATGDYIKAEVFNQERAIGPSDR